MIYPANFETKVGFDRIRMQVAALCSTEKARQLAAAEPFSSSQEEVLQRLRLTDEMRSILLMEQDFPSEEFTDTDQVIRKARIEGTFLEPDEIQRLRHTLVSVRDIAAFFSRKPAESYPWLRQMLGGIDGFPALINHIDTILDRFGNIKDSASAELYSIRRTIRDREGQVSKRLQSILSQAQQAGFVDPDATVSIRDGRAVIPVAAANKKKIRGFIHDESATGRTFYIEPVEVVEINNELRELEYAERREIVNILTAFTDLIRPDLDEIARADDYLAEMDFIRAKGRFAVRNDCVMPILSQENRIELRGARHPLLVQTLKKEGKQVVPLDLTLDPAHRILVISGPNAGGKSVCLKTTGLLQYMFQCGFPIPVRETSELPLFDSLFIDIGDEQSIDNDLSTYSSHLLNMKHMLAGASERSLVLIDEFGSGTEPVIGGAIAEAILEKLVEKGTFGIITTHYSNIKYYASDAPGVLNGAMTFDVQNIRPLFRLETGKPGSSFAIEIARKIGLPEEIIRQAGEKAGSDHIQLEKQLREIARDRRYWEQKRDRIRIADRKVEELEERYAEQLARIRQERTDILHQAREEARSLVAEANRQIENTIRTIRESQAEKELTRLARREVEEFKEKLEQDEPDPAAEQRIEREMQRIESRRQRRRERNGDTPSVPQQEKEPAPREVVVGSKVRIADQDTVGEVMQLKGKKAVVAFGQILTTVDKDRLVAISNSEYKRQTRPAAPRTVVSEAVTQRKLNFRQHIDVRGFRVAEALDEVRDFIDDAIMMGASEVRILHGKGTGALKEEIRNYLRSVPEVAGAGDEHVELGGAGITVVKFRI